MKTFLSFLAICFFTSTYAQNSKAVERDLSVSPFIDGTLLLPNGNENPPLAILVGGSGPTDRDGNQQMQRTNCLKYLAQGLSEKGIASFRYDKRIIKQMKDRTLNEESIRFDDFIVDAKEIISYFKKANSFSKIYVVGHSQGSLVGMVAAQDGADGFISIAGAGQEIDDVVVDQIAKQAPGLKDNARQSFDDMRANGVAQNYSPGLSSIFRPQIQPFMLTWMQYNPNVEIKKLEVPIFIINGDKDLQVQVSEAEMLKEARPDAKYSIVKNMNHILKEITGNDIDNSKSYNRPDLPVMPELVNLISDFIQG
ncbi:alpha/beta hydrolase [Aureisphaera galaxeae]|uniref:alpha/beta hydrolase family protein n=1 Tax=Aureisphaera galaxeae TaxID=1538023 RepID=UPI0023509729|nr:alpha/beta hydrolase [Aureisphaera galaxeae]MDC8004516.1 alpha/beta hydrolase [Aureisphaera galaxeae]